MESVAQSEPRSRRPLQPAVLFLDDCGYEHFDQMPGALKRRGVAPIRLRIPSLSSRRAGSRFVRGLRDRLFYARCAGLGRPEAESLLGQGPGGAGGGVA